MLRIIDDRVATAHLQQLTLELGGPLRTRGIPVGESRHARQADKAPFGGAPGSYNKFL
jgi:hypothetical protein